MHWNHTNTRLSTTKILGPTIFKQEIDAQSRQHFDHSLTFLNEHLGENDFVAGTSQPTIADLILVPELDQQLPNAFNLVDMTRFPNIIRYIERIKAAVQSYEEILAPVLVMAAQLKAATEPPIAICPKCGKGDKVIPCIRGRPGSELIAKARAGLVHLGGCTEGPAKGWCKECEEFVME